MSKRKINQITAHPEPDESINYDDPRVKDTIKHIKILARRHSRHLGIYDYLEYRSKHAPQLPSLNTIYRLFGSWPDLLVAAGIDDAGERELSRTSDEKLIQALKQASKDLDVTVLSSHVYDEYRRTQSPDLPSSSVIRKWLGPWADAVQKAGLETTERATPRKATRIEVIDAIRKAKQEVSGLLTEEAYAEFIMGLPEEEKEEYPDLLQILNNLPTWEAALKAADVEQSDMLHPNGLWTAEEARRIYQQAQIILNSEGKPVNKENYEKIVTKSSKQMPSWKVLSDLLKL